jgi:uncharacterized protein with NAD-binding domain and iron-sulfur cluster
MPEKTKVAVIGGGVSALAAVYALTSTEELRNQYDVTIYQLGHRLGGKGASGRNLEPGNGKRIEEHGLHIWFGFYENAFRVMKDAYVQMHRPSGPVQTWKEAFHKHSYVVLMETMNSGLEPWTFVFPENTDDPGTSGILPSPLAYAEMAIEWLLKFFDGELDVHAPPLNVAPPAVPDHVEAAVAKAEAKGAQPRPDRDGHGSIIEAGPIPIALHPVATLFRKAHTVLRSLENDVTTHTAHEHSAISWLIKEAMDVAWFFLKGRADTDLNVRKLWVAINLTGSAVAGMIDDGVFFHGFSALERYDLCEWLRNNGANDCTIERSGAIRGIYDLVFGFVGGDVHRGNFAAGTALRGILRMLFTYKGALMFRMEAGMGDIVATPFYEVLKARGVKFKFFHRVKELSVDGARVNRITITKQAKLVDESNEYQPLVEVSGIPCWPSKPLYDQLENGAELAKDSDVDFESAWSAPWKDESEVVLELGQDFDKIILAASIAALRDIAQPMLRANPALQDSVDNVLTAQTQALQLWVSKTTTDLGWVRPGDVTEDPVLGAYYEPIDTWADMSDLIVREDWGANAPKSIAYFCGPWIDAKVIPPYTDHDFPRQERARYESVVAGFISDNLARIWPNFQPSDEMSRYVRVNIDPTERYVLSVKGSTKFRLRADQSGFENVVLCGDWTQNGFNAGCVEAAVMGGLWASNALCGVPAANDIVGSDRT